MRVCCTDGNSDGCTGLDDNVSEEDGSFDELTDGTPYLQPEVDLSTLNQVSNQTRVCLRDKVNSKSFGTLYKTIQWLTLCA